MVHPQIIFLDAMGTLFGIRGTVGELYGQLAQAVGVDVDYPTLNQAFIDTFRASPPAAFPGAIPEEIPQLEYAWWHTLARQSFERVGALQQFQDFEAFFQDLFAYFATSDPWVVYPEVPQVLAQWQQQGLTLGVISNFDSRLHAVLEVLGLAQFFSSITLSTEAGAAKPEAEIFRVALAKHGLKPDQAWHIGDSWMEDRQGAIAAGLTGIWLNRDSLSEQKPVEYPGIPTLSALQIPTPA